MEVTKSTFLCICYCIIHSCLDEHLALGARTDGGAVDRHGLAVTRELQGELLLHQLPDHLVVEKGWEKSRNGTKEEEERDKEDTELNSWTRGQVSGWQLVGDWEFWLRHWQLRDNTSAQALSHLSWMSGCTQSVYNCTSSHGKSAMSLRNIWKTIATW